VFQKLPSGFRIRVGRSIQGFGLSPGITKEQRVAVEKLAASALSKLTGKSLQIMSLTFATLQVCF
jgi:hypothetical protein